MHKHFDEQTQTCKMPFDWIFLQGKEYKIIQMAGADPGFDQGGAPDRDRPKTAILGPQFCRILVLGPHFWWSGGARAPPGSAPGWKHIL